MKYDIITAKTKKKLVEIVQKKLDAGWTLKGKADLVVWQEYQYNIGNEIITTKKQWNQTIYREMR